MKDQNTDPKGDQANEGGQPSPQPRSQPQPSNQPPSNEQPSSDQPKGDAPATNMNEPGWSNAQPGDPNFAPDPKDTSDGARRSRTDGSQQPNAGGQPNTSGSDTKR